MKWQRWHVVAASVALALASVVALGKCSGGPHGVDAGAVATEPLAQAPDDLLADIYVASPNASWTKLQRGVGGAVGILPTTLPGVLVAVADLDISLATELDGTAPMYGVVAGDPADPTIAFAMKLVDARRARGLLADGDTARFSAKDVSGMTVLVPNRSTSADRKLQLAITQNGYLLVARAEADFARLGPYVTRTLPARPLPVESAAVIEIGRKALETMLQPKIDALWKDGKSFLLTQDERMRAERGRAPDFGDPAAIVAALDSMLARRVAIFGDLEKLRVALDVTDDATVVTATLTPRAGDGPARKWVDGMKIGDASPILALPAVSALALSMRDSEAERAEQSKELEKTIATSLGPRLKDPGKLHDVIEAMTSARDEAAAFALALDEPTGLLVRAPVRDAAAADKAIRGLFDLTKAEPFKELLRVRDVSSTSEELPGRGKISSVTVVREAKDTKRGTIRRDAGAPTTPAAKTSSASGAAWITEQGVLSLGAGAEPVVTLKIGAQPDRKLADEPALKRFTGAIASDASTIVVAQPLRLDPKRANLPTAPLGIAIGKKSGDGFVRIDIADGLLREAARSQMGF